MRLLCTFLLLMSLQYGLNAQAPVRYKYCELEWDYYYNCGYGNEKTTVSLRLPDKTEHPQGSLIEILNQLGSQGWELISVYLDEYDCGTQYTYLFKMRI